MRWRSWVPHVLACSTAEVSGLSSGISHEPPTRQTLSRLACSVRWGPEAGTDTSGCSEEPASEEAGLYGVSKFKRCWGRRRHLC